MNRTQMTAPFAEEELQTFAGRGGKTMTYIEDETVMDRLDAGYGYGNWQIQVEPVTEAVVKVKLGVREHNEWLWFEDFGYPNREGGESLKEAVSDGIRRCGRYVGIARDLYRKDPNERRTDSSQPVPGAPRILSDRRPLNARPEPVTPFESSVEGKVTAGKPPADINFRQTPDGMLFGFVVQGEGNKRLKVMAVGGLADALQIAGADKLKGVWVTAHGLIERVPWQKDGRDMPPYQQMTLARLETPEWTLPAPEEVRPAEAASEPLGQDVEELDSLAETLPWPDPEKVS